MMWGAKCAKGLMQCAKMCIIKAIKGGREVKRRDIIKKLVENGFEKKRSTGGHDIYFRYIIRKEG